MQLTAPMPRSVRSQVITRRTYCRPLDENETQFETWPMVVGRVVEHQRRLWEDALGCSLRDHQNQELDLLGELLLDRKVCVAGRTLWLGGTDIAYRRPASQFNCSFAVLRTVHDAVDLFWLLLQGCGVGFKPSPGALFGFCRPMEVRFTKSKRGKNERGREHNIEWYDSAKSEWTISVGDSAEAWAKSLGKILAGKFPATKLHIDFSEIRGAGTRLKGYGWLSSGDSSLSVAYQAIVGIMNKAAGRLLSKIEMLDIINWCGTVLSSRRSAEIALVDYKSPEWLEFASAKTTEKLMTEYQRYQSNNSVVYYAHPGRAAIQNQFQLMMDNGGSEPGMVNGEEAVNRAPWFAGVNPCGEILLADRGFCNLVTINLPAFRGNNHALHEAARIIARANYRQTCVDLRDGILQTAWHENNQFLRLCGVSVSGIAQRPDLTAHDYRRLRNSATFGAYSMADELGLQRPGNVTTIKPEGTISKAIFDSTEGCHYPLGKHIFNNVCFGQHDPLLPKLREAGYEVRQHPSDPTSMIVTLPVEWSDVKLTHVNGCYVNCQSAVEQLERYRMLMQNYCDQNVSVTISYDDDEKDEITDWLNKNWSDYVGVSFIRRADPFKTAEDLGYPYLPQEVVTEERYREYAAKLKPLIVDSIEDHSGEIDVGQDCAGGMCPVR